MEISRRVGYRFATVRFAILSFGSAGLAAGLAASALAKRPAQPSTQPPAVSAALTREFQAGVDAYRLGKYDDARAHLDKAQAIDPKLPGPHRFLAAVAQAQHRWADCLAEARRALQLNPQSKEIAETRKLHADCRAADGRPAYDGELAEGAAITVTANVTGATVRINGLRYGGTPVAPRPITPGTLEVDVERSGYRPVHLTVEALPGIVTDVAASLEAADARPAPPPGAPGTPPPSPPTLPPAAKPSARPSPLSPPSGKPGPAKPAPAGPG